MKKFLAILLAAVMCLSIMPVLADAEQYTGSAQGFGSEVKVTFTVDGGKITTLDVDDSAETYTLAGIERANSVEKLIAAILEAGATEGVDVNTGATFTSKAVVEAIDAALAAGGEEAPIAFTAGEYEATAEGFNGPTVVKVTFTDKAIEKIEIVSTGETDTVGVVAFETLIPLMIEANGTGVDGVTGATFSSDALRTAVNDAAEQAGCTDLEAFKAATVEPAEEAPAK